jgi:hypothetical protein
LWACGGEDNVQLRIVAGILVFFAIEGDGNFSVRNERNPIVWLDFIEPILNQGSNVDNQIAVF